MNEEMIQRLNQLISDVQNLVGAVNSLCCGIKLGNKPTYTNSEMMELFQVTSPTLKKWRNDGELSYTKIGDKYYYSVEDIEKFLRNHHNLAYEYEK